MGEPASSQEKRIRQLEDELRRKDQLLAQALRRESRYRQLMETNMVGVLFWHRDGRVLEANDKVLEVTGYDRNDLEQGRVQWLAMTPPEFADRERFAHGELAATGVCTPFEKEYIRKDGSRIPVLIGGAMLKESPEEGVCFLLDNSDRQQTLQRLNAAKRLFHDFMDNSPAVAFIKDANGRRVYLNRRYRTVFDDGSELLGRDDIEMYGPEIAETLRRSDFEVIANKAVHQEVLHLPAPDGADHAWFSYKFPIEDEHGKTLVGGVAVDITPLERMQLQLQEMNQELEHRVQQRTAALEEANRELQRHIFEKEKMQEVLRKSETRFRKWLEQSIMPVQAVDRDGRTTQVNRAWEQLWGITLDDAREIDLLYDAQMKERGLSTYLEQAFAGEATVVPETAFIPDRGVFAGQERWTRALIYPVKDDVTGEVEEIVLLHEDVSQRRAMEEKLRAEERILRKLLELQEQERKVIAYDIHERLVQDLIGGQMLLETSLHRINGSAGETLMKANSIFVRAIDEARRMISVVRPLVIDEKGIVQAIKYLTAEMEQQGEMAIEFFHRVHFDRLPSVLEGALFRIVQEGLTNVKRHSGSTEAEVWLQQEGDRLKLQVRDYGCGFDVNQVPDDRFGLEGIRRRAQIFQGSCYIDSDRGEGTTIRVEIPLALLANESPPKPEGP